jgi:hypothetical protein
MVNWLPAIPITGNVIFPQVWESSVIFVRIASPTTPVWRKAGYLTISIDVDGESILADRQIIEFGKNLITIPVTDYKLSFEPVPNLTTIYPNTTISLYQLTLAESQSIMPNYSPMPTSVGDQPVLDSLPTSFSAPGYTALATPASYQCLPANAGRQTFAVTNTGTAPVYLDLDAPTAANKRFVGIVAGGTYVSDFAYVGAVFIWSTNATAQPCEIREFIQ